MERLFVDDVMTVNLGGPISREMAMIWLDRWEASWRAGTSFCGIVVLAGSNERIGSASIHPSSVPQTHGVEISYMILPEFQRRGFAIEIAKGLVDHAFGVMRVERILITASPANAISNRIAERLRFECLGEFRYEHPAWPGHDRHVIWSLDRIVWGERKFG
jgi:RimJ/RimL family protein N-acetyltransferase